jgi:hypothetical protein
MAAIKKRKELHQGVLFGQVVLFFQSIQGRQMSKSADGRFRELRIS